MVFNSVPSCVFNWLSAFLAPPCLNSLNGDLSLTPRCSYVERNILISSQKMIQPTTCLGNAIFKSFSFFQPTLFDLASFSPSKFVSFSSSASVSAQSCPQNLYHHSFSQSMCLGLTSASLMSWSLLKHFTIKLNFMTAALWYLKKKVPG